MIFIIITVLASLLTIFCSFTANELIVVPTRSLPIPLPDIPSVLESALSSLHTAIKTESVLSLSSTVPNPTTTATPAELPTPLPTCQSDAKKIAEKDMTNSSVNRFGQCPWTFSSAMHVDMASTPRKLVYHASVHSPFSEFLIKDQFADFSSFEFSPRASKVDHKSNYSGVSNITLWLASFPNSYSFESVSGVYSESAVMTSSHVCETKDDFGRTFITNFLFFAYYLLIMFLLIRHTPYSVHSLVFHHSFLCDKFLAKSIKRSFESTGYPYFCFWDVGGPSSSNSLKTPFRTIMTEILVTNSSDQLEYILNRVNFLKKRYSRYIKKYNAAAIPVPLSQTMVPANQADPISRADNLENASINDIQENFTSSDDNILLADALHSASGIIVIPDSPNENEPIKAIHEPDAEYVQRMECKIGSNRSFVNAAKKVVSTNTPRKNLKIISGLCQDMLDLNRSVTDIDPLSLEVAESLECKYVDSSTSLTESENDRESTLAFSVVLADPYRVNPSSDESLNDLTLITRASPEDFLETMANFVCNDVKESSKLNIDLPYLGVDTKSRNEVMNTPVIPFRTLFNDALRGVEAVLEKRIVFKPLFLEVEKINGMTSHAAAIQPLTDFKYRIIQDEMVNMKNPLTDQSYYCQATTDPAIFPVVTSTTNKQTAISVSTQLCSPLEYANVCIPITLAEHLREMFLKETVIDGKSLFSFQRLLLDIFTIRLISMCEMMDIQPQHLPKLVGFSKKIDFLKISYFQEDISSQEIMELSFANSKKLLFPISLGKLPAINVTDGISEPGPILLHPIKCLKYDSSEDSNTITEDFSTTKPPDHELEEQFIQVIEPISIIKNTPSAIEYIDYAQPLLMRVSKSLQSVASESKIIVESQSITQPKVTEAEDTTSDLVSEKLSELEIISDNFLSKTSESAGLDKSYKYEDDFEYDEESSEILPEHPPAENGSEYLHVLAETTISEEPIGVGELFEGNQTNVYQKDLEQGVNILCRELDHIFQANAKFDEPPLIPMAELEGILPAAVAPLLLDCLESAINSQFQKHEAYNNPIRPLYEKKLIKPAPISSEKLVSVAKKRLFEGIQYPKTYGTNIDLFLAEIVKEEGKSYCENQQDLVHVKLEMVDSIFNDLINDTVNCLLKVSNEEESEPLKVPSEAERNENKGKEVIEYYLHESPMEHLNTETSANLVNQNDKFSEIEYAKNEFIDIAGGLEVDWTMLRNLIESNCRLHYETMDEKKSMSLSFETFCDRIADSVFEAFFDSDSDDSALKFNHIYSSGYLKTFVQIITCAMPIKSFFDDEIFETFEIPEIKKRKRFSLLNSN